MYVFKAGATGKYLPELRGERVLVAYPQVCQHPMLDARAQGELHSLILDCGSFSVWSSQAKAPHLRRRPIDLQSYCRFVRQQLARGALDYAIALDHIPGEPGREPTPAEGAEAGRITLANLEAMLEANIPRAKLMPVLPYGAPLVLLQRYLAMGFRTIALGALVRRPKSKALPWLDQVFRAYPPEAWGGRVRYHLLGLTTAWSLELPAHSCDSTTWLEFARHGFAGNMHLLADQPSHFRYSRWSLHQVQAGLVTGEAIDKTTRRELGLLAVNSRARWRADEYLPPKDSPEYESTRYRLQCAWSMDDEAFDAWEADPFLVAETLRMEREDRARWVG